MDWSRPEFLYLILPLAAVWLALSLFARRRRQRAAEAFVAQTMWSRILPADSRLRFWVKLLFREAAIIAGLVALAGPRFGTQYEEVIPRGSDLYILIDVSRSMLAEDVPPSRLGRAKADVASLVNRLEGERVGLIAFAGQSVVKCPLTVDYDSFRRSLDELDPGSAPRGGTAIGDAIRKALEVFKTRAERDQAILLITDGDDQQSYPLEAAAVAAEKQVTIFTVGLGDADQGARVPKGGATPAYVEYEGQQVWSKLDSSLLQEIALKTSGVYVPVGTRSYDLGELYADHLKGRRGADDETHKRLRRSEQFQTFLALALFSLLAELLIGHYPRERQSTANAGSAMKNDQPPGGRGSRRAEIAGQMPAYGSAGASPSRFLPCLTTTIFAGAALAGAVAHADDPTGALRDGLQLYRQDEFDKARDKFAEARQGFEKGDAGKAAVAAFDEACASHRRGDVAHAREWYLQAGLAHDKMLAAAAHFNLGTLAAEEARRLAGEHPEDVPPEKRQEILDQLASAVASFRHCLELQPDNSRVRRDIELVRQWIRYYSGKWHERDRQKRREEANLVAFLEFLIETQRALKESVKSLPATAPADAFAELKRLQSELHEEIEPLKNKIRADLTPTNPAGQSQTAADSQELEQGLALLNEWADVAGEKMSSAASRLGRRQPKPAIGDQQSAVDELVKIWEAVIPFHALLTRDLADQTRIVSALAHESSGESKSATEETEEKSEIGQDKDEPVASDRAAAAGSVSLETESEDLARLIESQEQTRRRTQLLKLKAEAELERVEKTLPSGTGQPDHALPPDSNGQPDGEASSAKPVDPEEIKAGYRKAIELSPQAVEKMEATAQSLKKNDRQAAYPTAEEARKILEEIQQAQPKNEQQDQKQDQNKDQNDEQQKDKQNEQQKDDEQQKNQPDQKQDDEKKKDKQNQPDDKNKSGDKPEKQPQVSRDQIEEALRKVRERQQEKRERDRKLKARATGKVPVDKDW